MEAGCAELEAGYAGVTVTRREIAVVRSIAQRVHPWLVGLFAIGVILQGYLAGAALPQLGGTGDFETHLFVGYTVLGILALLILIAGLVGRADRVQVWGSIALFVLYIVQTALPTFRGSSPLLAALHPANAIVLFGLAAWLAVRRRPTVA
jgi:hypothetical protein